MYLYSLLVSIIIRLCILTYYLVYLISIVVKKIPDVVQNYYPLTSQFEGVEKEMVVKVPLSWRVLVHSAERAHSDERLVKCL